MARRYNPKAVKIHNSYSIEEAANALGVTVQTIRAWAKKGLPILKAQRPFLILGCELRDYIEQRLDNSRVSLAAGEFYCLSCRKPTAPFGMMADYIASNASRGRLEALCSICECKCSRLTSKARLPEFASIMDIACH